MSSIIYRSGKATKYKNLAGIIREMRKRVPVKYWLKKHPDSEKGELTIEWKGGDYAIADFASYLVMCHWTNSRRVLKGVECVS